MFLRNDDDANGTLGIKSSFIVWFRLTLEALCKNLRKTILVLSNVFTQVKLSDQKK